MSQLKSTIVFLFVLSVFVISCENQPNQPNVKETIAPESTATNTALEEELKAVVEKFLKVAGNYDLEAMDAMISDKANLGIAVVRDGVWKNSVSIINEYFERAKNNEPRPYFEPVNEYKILVNQEQIAFVWADATLYSYGVARTNNIDNFTLIKEDGEWQFINLSFTNTRLPEELRKFDLEVFARSYAQAWCSERPNFVASYFSEDGSLKVNDAEPAKGRAAIAEVVEEFMTDFPDLEVHFDRLEEKTNGTEFHWTLTGTNTGPNGTGNKVKVSGYELWTFGEDGLIKASLGQFSS